MLERAEAAEALLTNPLLKEALQILRERAYDRLIGCPVMAPEVMAAHAELKYANAFDQILTHWLNDAKMLGYKRDNYA